MTNAQTFLEPFAEALKSAREAARAVFPEESCGIVVDGKYIACENNAADPALHTDDPMTCNCRLCSFSIDKKVLIKHGKSIQLIIHSHPNGPVYPSSADMKSQQLSGVAWVIIPLDEARFGAPIVWGGLCPIEPLIGRTFTHGVNDCYSLIQDAFLCGRDEMLNQGMAGWPFDPVIFPSWPRDDSWWLGSDDFYADKPSEYGFKEISSSEVRPGDVFLGKIKSDKLNHGGLLIGNNLILHHLPNRLSRREPAGLWARQAVRWIRYTGQANA